MRKPLLTLLVALVLTGCYRMPAEDEYSVIPSINNPDVTRVKSNTPAWVPNQK